MPKAMELRKVIKRLKRYGIIYKRDKGRHPKFYDPEIKKSYPVKSHGKKTMVLPYALNDMIDKFELPADVFETV
ncbi:YcfA-like protein [Candidatus Magnetomorum sp. HK-1]|nr:YcfA-like protein [Candidatus Magnetomorum sp. HK-1]